MGNFLVFQSVFSHELSLCGHVFSWLQVPFQELLNLLDEFCSNLMEGQKGRILRNNHALTRSVNTDIMIEEWELNSCPDWANIIVSLGSWYSLAHLHLLLLALQGCCPWSGKETKLMQWGWRWAEWHRKACLLGIRPCCFQLSPQELFCG